MFPWLPWVWRGIGGEYIQPCGPLLSRLSCSCCFSACIEGSLAWGPSYAHAWASMPKFAPPHKEMPLYYSPLGES